jgi:hypothetical protein
MSFSSKFDVFSSPSDDSELPLPILLDFRFRWEMMFGRFREVAASGSGLPIPF